MGVMLVGFFGPNSATAQTTSSEEGIPVRSGGAGYIDNALPGTLFRLRVDVGYNNRQPTRAEFFYAKPGPAGPGLPRPEPSTDYQEIFGYLEGAVNERLSVFVDVPYRFLNPEVNLNANDFSDLSGGFKYAFVYEKDLVATFQLRTYVPTGDSRRGLGTNHTSIEPGVLLYAPLMDKLALLGELRLWVPINGTDFSGQLVRYGAGAQYCLYDSPAVQFTPVVELVGWTALSGLTGVVPPIGTPSVVDASGQTVFNVKAGARIGLGEHLDFYAGYGRPLTANRWYENTFRIEMRLVY